MKAYLAKTPLMDTDGASHSQQKEHVDDGA